MMITLCLSIESGLRATGPRIQQERPVSLLSADLMQSVCRETRAM